MHPGPPSHTTILVPHCHDVCTTTKRRRRRTQARTNEHHATFRHDDVAAVPRHHYAPHHLEATATHLPPVPHHSLTVRLLAATTILSGSLCPISTMAPVFLNSIFFVSFYNFKWYLCCSIYYVITKYKIKSTLLFCHNNSLQVMKMKKIIVWESAAECWMGW